VRRQARNVPRSRCGALRAAEGAGSDASAPSAEPETVAHARSADRAQPRRPARSKMTTYPHLASPIQIGASHPQEPFHEEWDGVLLGRPGERKPHERPVHRLLRGAREGGAALVSSASGPLTRDTGAPLPGFKITVEEAIPGWRRWADTIHRYDCLAFGQLFHLGPMTPLFVAAPAGISASSIAASSRPGRASRSRTRQRWPRSRTWSSCSLRQLSARSAPASTAPRSTAPANHFLNNFLSGLEQARRRLRNADPRERTRPFTSVIREIKRRNGADWPIIALFNGREVDLDDGITIDEAKAFARALVEGRGGRPRGAGGVTTPGRRTSIAARASTSRTCTWYPHRTGPVDPYVDASRMGAGANIPIAAEIKKVVPVPRHHRRPTGLEDRRAARSPTGRSTSSA